MGEDSIRTTRLGVASKAELDSAVADYTARGFQLKAVSETTASLEKIESPYVVWKGVLLYLLCIIPGVVYTLKNPPTKKVGEVILIQVEAASTGAGVA
jgi:hypothetical protein